MAMYVFVFCVSQTGQEQLGSISLQEVSQTLGLIFHCYCCSAVGRTSDMCVERGFVQSTSDILTY